MFRTFLHPKLMFLPLLLGCIGCSAVAEDAVMVIGRGQENEAVKQAFQSVPPQTTKPEEAQPVESATCEGTSGESGAIVKGLGDGSYRVKPGPSAEALWVREGNGLSESVIGCLLRGETVNIKRVEESWALIEFQSGEGWAWMEYLD